MQDTADFQIRPWDRVTAIMPLLSSAERRALQQSINEYGVIYPVLVLPDGRIVDGHNRWELSQGDCPFEVLDLEEGTAEILAVALNMHRRHLSHEQQRDVWERWRQMPKERQEAGLLLRQQGMTQQQVADTLGVSQKTVDNWEGQRISSSSNPLPDLRVSIPKQQYPAIAERRESGETLAAIAADYQVTPERIGQVVQLVEARQRVPDPVGEVPYPDGTYRCIVIDPPWPVQKIEREERPVQSARLDYPTMSLDDIRALPVPVLADDAGCHLYLWVTQKFLPDGLQLCADWGFRYQCLMTWVKPTGFTPFSWMYNTEHVIFARRGSLDLDRMGLKLSFDAGVVRHSEKPDVFYERVLAASPGPRLEMFARADRDGFVVWGNEVLADVG